MDRMFSWLRWISAALILPALISCTLLPGAGSPREDFTFVQICDPQLGMGGYEHDVEMLSKAVDQVNKLNPDFVIICGDLVHHRSEKSFADFKRIAGQFEVPVYCVPGNHDVGGEPTPESLANYRQVIGPDYYSFEHKGYTFVFVNTQLWKNPVKGETGKQDRWLREVLETAAKKKTPVFVAGHYPFFVDRACEDEGYMNLPLSKRMELLLLYKKTGVVAVLGGHTHRLVMNYSGMQLVNGESLSKNFDNRPLGFRLWYVAGSTPFKHAFFSVE